MTEIIDASERFQALEPTQSFIVQAPAGSGKTELLIQRFLKLLSGVERPEQILAMTFTRKAAAEMKTRIMNALERANSTEPPQMPHELHTWNLARKALEHDSRQGWRLLENPSRMKIQTIDSFSATLARQTPLLSGMGALLDVEENASELYRITAHRILDMVERNDDNGKAIRNIVSRLDNSKLSFLGRIIQLLQKRDQWIIPFFKKELNSEDTKIYLEQTLENIVTSFLIEADSLLSNDQKSELADFAAFAGNNLSETNPEHVSAVLKDLQKFPAPNTKQLAQWKGIANILLTKDGAIRKKPDIRIGFPADKGEPKKKRNNFISFLESLADKPGLAEILYEVMLLPDPKFSDEDWEFLKSIFLLLPELDKTLRQVFMEKRKTDFTQIALSALNALGEELDPSDLLLKLDMKIQHILVDEFQDISYKQFELIKLLTTGWTPIDGRTLFIVGDPMQSIYRFRDAEVGLFLQARDQGIGDISLTSLKLKTNFRSQKKVVDWVNKCFSAIFPKVDDPDRGAIEYAPSIAAHPEDPGEGVIIHPVSDPAGPEEAEAVTELIQKIREDHPDASIAILVRARTHLIEIVRKLHASNVKFRAEEIDPLTARPAILDLLSLMRALLSHSDRVSWLSILRAPFCGISLKDLHQLCWKDPLAPVWDLLNNKEITSQLSVDGQQRIGRLTEILSRAFDYFPQTHFRILLEGAWINLGGPACLDDSMMDDATVFFDKVEEALDSGEMENLQNFERVLASLYANPETGEDSLVQIMTMHKAKGLEFDFVLMPGLGKRHKADTGRLVYWLPHGDDLLMAPMQETGEPQSPAYDFLSRLDKAKDKFEVFRILYVSATRAKKQLHLFGHTEKKEDAAKPPANSLLKSLWPYLEYDWNIALRRTPPATKLPEKEPEPKIQISRLPTDFQIPDPLPAIETGPAIELSDEEEDTPTFDWAGNKARLLGTVLHQCFKDILEDGLENWDAARINQLKPSLKSALLGEGLSINEIEQTCNDGIKALNNILNDKIGVWILSNHEDSQAEYALTYRKGKKFITRRIDRTFVDEDDVRWIIDYKTGEHGGTNLEQFFQEEKKRYRPQLERYEELFKLKGETRTIKKALYYPMHRKLVEIK